MHWHLRRGEFDLYGIEDGHRMADPEAIFPDAPPEVWSEHPERLEDGRFTLSSSCYVVRTPTDLVMVDSGFGPMPDLPPGATSGAMPGTLAAIGVRPEEVEHVILTHLHRDHIGGLRMPTGDAFFPEALLHVASDELDHWMRLEGPRGDAVREIMQGFVDEGRIRPLTDGGGVVAGIETFTTPGHTPGHMSVDLRSDGVRTVIAGDISHHPFQAGLPEVCASFDADATTAAETRRRVFADLAEDGAARMAIGHYAFPGYGRVERDGDRPVFVYEDIEVAP